MLRNVWIIYNAESPPLQPIQGIKKFALFFSLLIINDGNAYWDVGTTTVMTPSQEAIPRQSFFRWQRTEFENQRWWFPYFDWVELTYRRALNVVAGISIDLIPLSTATILNERTVITSANFLEPHMNRQRDLRIWALGRAGYHNTPYRYRVWRVRRLFPRSINPEHSHGPRGIHVPRHDVAIVHSLDQIYILLDYPKRYHYATKSTLPTKHYKLEDPMWYVGSGYWNLEHIYENYKIWYSKTAKAEIIDCSIVLPKWWGKFICIRNIYGHMGLQNGGPLFANYMLVGLGCFEIRYNEHRILVFTDLRYYMDYIYKVAHIKVGEYYEYAYPQWSVHRGMLWDSQVNTPYLPTYQKVPSLYPLGR